MRILINKNYFFALPTTTQEARTLIVLQAKQIYRKELKFAKMITIKGNKGLKVGVLTRRTI